MSSHSFGRGTFLLNGRSLFQVQFVLFLLCEIFFLLSQQIRNEASKPNKVSLLVIFNKQYLLNNIYHIIDIVFTNIKILWASFPSNWHIGLIKYICILFLLAILDVFQDTSLANNDYVFKCLHPVLRKVFSGWKMNFDFI